MKTVIVVTGLELGWDCIVGVFKDEEALLNSWLFEEYEPEDRPKDIKEMCEIQNYMVFTQDVEE